MQMCEMTNWILMSGLLVLACVQPSCNVDENCPSSCQGEGYECVSGYCYCADGYIPNYYQTRCIRCPGMGQRCFGVCCNQPGNITLQCWQGICQPCYNADGKFICRDSLDQILLVSGTQIIMAASLILGIIATLILLYRLCAATTNIRPLGQMPNNEARLSVGSLQVYVDERLRDAPPRYSRSPQAGSAVYPATVYLNSGFGAKAVTKLVSNTDKSVRVHDNSVPPPPYTEDLKSEPESSRANANTVHM